MGNILHHKSNNKLNRAKSVIIISNVRTILTLEKLIYTDTE